MFCIVWPTAFAFKRKKADQYSAAIKESMADHCCAVREETAVVGWKTLLITLYASVTSSVKGQETAVPTLKVSRNHVALEMVSTV